MSSHRTEFTYAEIQAVFDELDHDPQTMAEVILRLRWQARRDAKTRKKQADKIAALKANNNTKAKKAQKQRKHLRGLEARYVKARDTVSDLCDVLAAEPEFDIVKHAELWDQALRIANREPRAR